MAAQRWSKPKWLTEISSIKMSEMALLKEANRIAAEDWLILESMDISVRQMASGY
jgi:hypothetical protein